MRKFYFAILLIWSYQAIAQTTTPRTFYNIANVWTDLNLSGKIAGKFSWQIEYQHRRVDKQGDYNSATTTGNIYHDLNQHLFRPYIHYQASPNVRFSLMPLGWMGSNRFANGIPSAFFSELRITPQVILTQNVKKLRIDHRYRYEFRWLGANMPVADHTFLYGGDFSTTVYRNRLRYQIKLTRPINKEKMGDKTLYAQAYDEVFVNMGKNVASINLLDQNRVLAGLGYRFNNNFALEAGFLRQSIYRFNNADKNNVDRNNILQINLAVTNVETLFKKK